MDEAKLLMVTHEALRTTLTVAGPPLAAGMVVGILFGLLQAMTQIHEATLTIIPKMAAVTFALALGGSWMLAVLTQFVRDLYLTIASVGP